MLGDGLESESLDFSAIDPAYSDLATRWIVMSKVSEKIIVREARSIR